MSIRYIKSTLGTNEIFDKPTYHIFPNPTNQNIEIDGNCEFVYKVSDMSGKILMQSTVTSKEKEQIDLGKLNSGVYLINIMSGDRTEKYKIEKL